MCVHIRLSCPFLTLWLTIDNGLVLSGTSAFAARNYKAVVRTFRFSVLPFQFRFNISRVNFKFREFFRFVFLLLILVIGVDLQCESDPKCRQYF